MLLLIAFLLTLAYYALLIGLDQKRKKQFALSQQIVLPTMEQLTEQLAEPNSIIESNPSKTISEDSIFGALDISSDIGLDMGIENSIPNSAAIAIDHLVHADSNIETNTTLKIDIPKLDTIPIANKPSIVR